MGLNQSRPTQASYVANKVHLMAGRRARHILPSSGLPVTSCLPCACQSPCRRDSRVSSAPWCAPFDYRRESGRFLDPLHDVSHTFVIEAGDDPVRLPEVLRTPRSARATRSRQPKSLWQHCCCWGPQWEEGRWSGQERDLDSQSRWDRGSVWGGTMAESSPGRVWRLAALLLN